MLLSLLACLPLVGVPAERAEHVFVFIKSGSERPDSEAEAELMRGHFANMERLAGLGHLSIAGPFGEPKLDAEDRGLWIFSGDDMEAVRPLAESDPCVESDVFQLELVPFATDWPLDVLPALTEIARLETNKEAGVRSYVLAFRTATAVDLGPAIDAGAVLFEGRFGGARAGTQVVALNAESLDDARKLLARHELGVEGWQLRPWWSSVLLTDLPRLRTKSKLRAIAPPGERSEAFGIPVAAAPGVDRTVVDHVATVLTEILDGDEDGRPDNPRVALALRASGARLFLGPDDAEPPRALFVRRLDPSDVHPDGLPFSPAARSYDDSITAVFELLAFGYGLAYPGLFGVGEATSRLADAEAQVAGKTWNPAEDLDRATRLRRYFAWGQSSRLGCQASPTRIDQIDERWKLATPTLLEAGNPKLWALLAVPRLALPTLPPDGRYR